MTNHIGIRSGEPGAPKSCQSVTGETLSEADVQRLAQLEEVIAGGERYFLEVGHALGIINEKRLYRQSHKTFVQYLKDRWPRISKTSAYQLMDAAEVNENVRHGGQNAPLENERQARELAKHEPEVQRETWDVATETGKTTAADLKEIAAKLTAGANPDRLKEELVAEEKKILDRKARVQERALQIGGQQLDKYKRRCLKSVTQLEKDAPHFPDATDRMLEILAELRRLIEEAI